MLPLRSGISIICEKLQPHRGRLKYLLVVPLLVAVALASFKIGHLSATRRSGEEAVSFRQRREVVDSIWSRNQSVRNSGGAIYTRWGRTECPTGSETVYAGVTGGSWYDDSGGGSDYLCLPLVPIWGTYAETISKVSRIYGSEYELPSSGFMLSNNHFQPLHNNNVPCAVCRSETKTSVVMIPARNLCYDGWQTEYSGYLMSENSGHRGRTQFICLDINPESDPAGYRNEDGALLYNVEGVCGSLPCPPYAPGRELTCVVCGK